MERRSETRAARLVRVQRGPREGTGGITEEADIRQEGRCSLSLSLSLSLLSSNATLCPFSLRLRYASYPLARSGAAVASISRAPPPPTLPKCPNPPPPPVTPSLRRSILLPSPLSCPPTACTATYRLLPANSLLLAPLSFSVSHPQLSLSTFVSLLLSLFLSVFLFC